MRSFLQCGPYSLNTVFNMYRKTDPICPLAPLCLSLMVRRANNETKNYPREQRELIVFLSEFRLCSIYSRGSKNPLADRDFTTAIICCKINEEEGKSSF